MDEELPPVARRIREARERSGLSEQSLAESLDLNFASYCDLEMHDDEAFTCISLAQLRTLAKLLGLSARTLLVEDQAQTPASDVSFEELVERIRSYIAEHALTVDDFGEQVGWDVASVLEEPQRAWDEWCVDELVDVCAPLGVPWQAVLPR